MWSLGCGCQIVGRLERRSHERPSRGRSRKETGPRSTGPGHATPAFAAPAADGDGGAATKEVPLLAVDLEMSGVLDAMLSPYSCFVVSDSSSSSSSSSSSGGGGGGDAPSYFLPYSGPATSDTTTGDVSTVEYTFGYGRCDDGKVRIFLHHSSVPYSG